MINFLPPEGRVAIRHEYVVRVLSIWALLFSFVALVEALLLLPTYVLLARQLDALAIEVVRMESDASTEAYETARTTLEGAHLLAIQLGVVSVGPAASEVWREIRKVQADSITLSGFSYTQTSTPLEVVKLSGIATTRKALTEFAAALERDPLFVRAEVPVSDLAEDRDLSFTLTITLANGGM